MNSAFESRRALPGILLAGLLFTTPVSAGGARILIGVESATSVTGVARYRLTDYLRTQGCEADVRFNTEAPGLALAFLPGVQGGGRCRFWKRSTGMASFRFLSG